MEEISWLKEWSSQGFAVVFGVFSCWIVYWVVSRGGRFTANFINEKLWPSAAKHIEIVNNALDTFGKNETRQTALMESMDGRLDSHATILDSHGKRLEEHGVLLHEIHQVVRKPLNGGA